MESIPKYNQFIRKWEVAIVIKYIDVTLFACVFLSHSLHLNDFIATRSAQETPQQLVCESLSSFFERIEKKK